MINDFFRRLEGDAKRTSDASAPSHPHVNSGAGAMRGHVEKQPDGSLLYRAVFDVHGYGPDDLRISLIGDKTVQVSGRTSLSDAGAGKRTSVSFDDQFALPDGVDTSQLRSVVANGQLVLSAPLLQSGKNSSAVLASAGAAQRQTQQQQQQQQQQQHQPQPPQQQNQHSTLKRVSIYQLELDLGRGEFTANDLRVATTDSGTRLVIHAQRQVRSAGKTSFREFRDEFDLPAGLDLTRMAARLRSDGRVFVEAPFRPETEPGFESHILTITHH